ncbi:MAG TPA: peptidoglycan endopeptidase [Chthoniobacterales bacterium]
MPNPRFLSFTSLALLLVCLCLLGGCSSTPPYQYNYRPGRSATLVDGYAVAPSRAPASVHRAIAAGNRIAGLPYKYGGGHRRHEDTGYDCSGATSYVLREAGLLRGTMTSRGFRKYGRSGEGKWFTVYANKGHVFLVVADLRFDTGYGKGARGPKWTTRSRPNPDYRMRRP